MHQYQHRLAELARLLYEHYPYSMGALAVPNDEYEPISQKLMPILSKATERSQLVRILEERGIDDPELVENICRIFSS
jgi:hypothetical protein